MMRSPACGRRCRFEDMSLSAHVLHDELADLQTLATEAIRRAGAGADPRFERRLDAQARTLCALLDAGLHVLVSDAIDAAKRVMDAADPAAPRLMLEIALRNLAVAVRRHAARTPLRHAA